LAEHAVIAHIRLSESGFGTPAERQRLAEFEDRLEKSIKKARVGEFDGNEFGEGECVWYMYGPDADALYRVVEAIIREAASQAGSFVVKRRGAADDPNAKEETIQL
jgi:Family of unknown function (DUF695)